MPVMGLELMAVVHSHLTDAERELVDDGVDEVDRVRPIVAVIDFRARMRVASSIAVYW
jgi:hypothetical protein